MKKVLIADDDPAIVESIGLILEIGGYEVATTTDRDTIRKMTDEHPNLLLLDVWMCGEDGREICKLLKSQTETKNIPVIMISASKNIEKSVKEAGADDFIAKPFDMEKLLTKIAKYTRDN